MTMERSLRQESSVFYRNLHARPLEVKSGNNNELILKSGRRIIDASCGAAVTSLGHIYHREILDDILNVQKSGLSYLPSGFFTHQVVEDYAQALVQSTGGEMAKVQFYGSGTESVESALKLTIQYYQEIGQSERRNFIACWESYHGASIMALGLGGHRERRERFKAYFPSAFHHVTPYNEYRRFHEEESVGNYAMRLIKELEDKIQELGGHTISAFVLEPVSGAALGCAPCGRSYLEGVRELCDKKGILLVFDETMCGMGRTGNLHAWQHYRVVPDIQIVGKGLAAGVQPISAMLIGYRVAKAFEEGSGKFSHGHTFQSHPLGCAAGLRVLEIMREKNLIENSRKMGNVLQEKLKKRIGSHANVGDIRGIGLFQGIEFVKNRVTREPFSRDQKVAESIHERCMDRNMFFYFGTGWADGKDGDGIIVAPEFTVCEKKIDIIVENLAVVIDDFFDSHNGPKHIE